MAVLQLSALSWEYYTGGHPRNEDLTNPAWGMCREWWVSQINRPGSPPSWNDPDNGLPDSSLPNGATINDLPSNLCSSFSFPDITLTTPGALRDWVLPFDDSAAAWPDATITKRGEFVLHVLGQGTIDGRRRYNFGSFAPDLYSGLSTFVFPLTTLLTNDNYYYERLTVTLADDIATTENANLTEIRFDWGNGDIEIVAPTFLRVVTGIYGPIKYWAGATSTREFHTNDERVLKVFLVDEFGRETEIAQPFSITQCKRIPRYCCAARLPSDVVSGMREHAANNSLQVTNRIFQFKSADGALQAGFEPRTPRTVQPGALISTRRGELWMVGNSGGSPVDGTSRLRLLRSRDQSRNFQFQLSTMAIWNSDDFIYTDIAATESDALLAVGVKAIGEIPNQTFSLWFRSGSRPGRGANSISWSTPLQITALERQEPFRVLQLNRSRIIVTNCYDLFFTSDDFGRTWQQVAV
jgi:hypothetical protein